MRILTRAALLTSTVALASAAPVTTPQAAALCCAVSTPYVSGTGGYHTYRIPALVQVRGTLVAFAEGRRNSAEDYGDIDVLARRSVDGGCTWGPMQVVADNGEDTVGNPAPVVDLVTGRIVLLTVRQPGTEAGGRDRRVYVQSSGDAGASWSPPAEISGDVKRPGWLWYATGPGHGIQLASGRLVVAADHTADEGRSHGSHLLLSDDHGATWRVGAIDQRSDGVLKPNETTVAQLPNGEIYANTRNQYGSTPAHRAITYSLDGGASFAAPFQPLPDLVAPVVQGSLLQDSGTSCTPLFFSAPQDPSRRRNLTIRRSMDGGRSWTVDAEITDGPAGYSDMAQLAPAMAGVLFETGNTASYERIDFRPFPITCGLPPLIDGVPVMVMDP